MLDIHLWEGGYRREETRLMGEKERINNIALSLLRNTEKKISFIFSCKLHWIVSKSASWKILTLSCKNSIMSVK